MTVHRPVYRPAAPTSRSGAVPCFPQRTPRLAKRAPLPAPLRVATWPFRVIAVALLQSWRRLRLSLKLEAMSDSELAAINLDRALIDAAVRDAFILWPGHPRWIASPLPPKRLEPR